MKQGFRVCWALSKGSGFGAKASEFRRILGFRVLGFRVRIEDSGFEALSPYMGVSEKRGPQCSTLNGRILIIKGPKLRYP